VPPGIVHIPQYGEIKTIREGSSLTQDDSCFVLFAITVDVLHA